eukprot:SAG25_NODE_245_length_11100_cov_4.621671_7_plen_167_part_00
MDFGSRAAGACLLWAPSAAAASRAASNNSQHAPTRCERAPCMPVPGTLGPPCSPVRRRVRGWGRLAAAHGRSTGKGSCAMMAAGGSCRPCSSQQQAAAPIPRPTCARGGSLAPCYSIDRLPNSRDQPSIGLNPVFKGNQSSSASPTVQATATKHCAPVVMIELVIE